MLKKRRLQKLIMMTVKKCTNTRAKSRRVYRLGHGVPVKAGPGGLRSNQTEKTSFPRPLKTRQKDLELYSRLPEVAADNLLVVENQNVGEQIHKENIGRKQKKIVNKGPK